MRELERMIKAQLLVNENRAFIISGFLAGYH